jgi:protein required for attachment to host cells
MNTHQHAASHATPFAFTNPAGTRVVVASQGEAHLYDVGPGTVVTAAGTMLDAKARLHDRDFSSDRPGRVFDRAPPAGRRGAGAHHSTGSERGPHRHEALVFARRIAAQLERERRLNRFSRMVIVAAPAFLGLLRGAMHPQLRGMIVGQVRKDLAHRPAHILKAHVDRVLAQREW